MVSEINQNQTKMIKEEEVLILVLLEDGIGEDHELRCMVVITVLILVLLEDGIGDNKDIKRLLSELS